MRAGGGNTVQQALTPEAGSIVKQAVSLARRRGHAQVTPLHVASTMLSSAGLLRAACLQSHSHPLQCKALELCFNVALNRLPTSASATAMLGHHHHHLHHHLPALSNALVAAFKRAQAHQRRGSVESQQQPLLAVKIELEQLIISILDDPSVSRVMREAGFSSTQVKTNVEKAVSSTLDTNTNTSTPPNPNPSINPKDSTAQLNQPQQTKPNPLNQVRNEDVMSVLDCMSSRKKTSIIVVGECMATVEGVVRVVMDRVSKGQVQETLKNLQFIPFSLSSFRLMSREEVEVKVGELRSLLRSSCAAGRGAVVVFEDLKWAAEAWASSAEKRRARGNGVHGYYCPVEHVVMEVGSLVCGNGVGDRVWMLGFATFETYIKCRAGHPSLEYLWGIHHLTIPADAGLALSLKCDGDSQSQAKAAKMGSGCCWSFLGAADQSELTCCAECSVKFNAEACSLPNASFSGHGSASSPSLPSWLRHYRQDHSTRATSDNQGSLHLQDLRNKWNSICNTAAHRSHHQPSELTLNFSSASPSSSISTYNQCYHPTLHQPYKPWSLSFEAKHPWRDHRQWLTEATDEVLGNDIDLHDNAGRQSASMQSANPNPNSTSSDGTMEVERRPRFKELNAENLKMLCNVLERRVVWQKDIVPEIASVVLQCRSGMRRRAKASSSSGAKEETWLFFQGGDSDGKERVARELANLVFGSYNDFISTALSTFLSARSDSSDDLNNKRPRSENAHAYLERLYRAICENPHRVIMIEDIEQLDYDSQAGIKNAIESGRIRSYNGDEVALDDAIIVLSCEVFDSRSRVCSPRAKQKVDAKEEKEDQGGNNHLGSCFSLDLNACAEDEGEEDRSLDNLGLLEAVDGAFFFRLPEDL